MKIKSATCGATLYFFTDLKTHINYMEENPGTAIFTSV